MVRVITGPNEFMAKQAYSQAINDFVKANSELALERIDCTDIELDGVVLAVSNLPFLEPKKMVVLKDLGHNKELAENIEKIVNSADSANEVLIFDLNIDRRSTYYKNLLKFASVNEHKELGERQLITWAQGFAKDIGGILSNNDAYYLVGRVGQNQLRLASEIEKLVAYEPTISRQSIDDLTEPTPQSKIFDLLDSAFAGNSQKALKIYDEQRLLKVEPQQIVGLMTWQLQAVAIVKYAKDRTDKQIASDSGLSPFAIQKSRRLASQISAQKLNKMVSDLAEIDYESKSSMLDADDALSHYIISIR